MSTKVSNLPKKLLTRDNIYVDTSFFIATQVVNHPFHQDACKLLESHASCTFFFSLLTIDEIVFTLLKHKIRREKIAQIIKDKIIDIKNARILTYTNNMKQLETYINTWNETKLAPRDALHLYLMKSKNIRYMATFDKEFLRKQEDLKITVIGLHNKKETKLPN